LNGSDNCVWCFFRRGFRRHLRLKGKPGNQTTTVQHDLHVECALFKLRPKHTRLADGLRPAEFPDSSHLLRQPLEERGRFVQRQRGVHRLVELGLDAGVIARVDQLDELVGQFRVPIRLLSRYGLDRE
jgi:hypothetical protein